jgi:hypothetical protein
MTKISYSGYRFPPEIIHQAIWLYLRFTLSLRDVEDLLAERGIAISYETIRRWVNHFGPIIAAELRKRRPRPHSIWHLDEVYLKIDGRMVYLWRAHIKSPNFVPKSTSDADIWDYVRQYASTVYHPTSTCAIGPVVDSELRVHGVERLRVVDASVMPSVVRGNTNAPTIMIAEKAADLIRSARSPAPTAA